MFNKCLLVLIATITLISCKKDYTSNPPAPPTPAPTFLLKDVVLLNLPSPYYHFEYNSSGKVVSTSIASGLETTNFVYNGDRISEVDNIIPANGQKLKYLYNVEGKVNVINYLDASNTTQKRVVLDYNGNKLVDLERQIRSGTSFITDKTMHFQYDTNDNLTELTYHYLAIPGQTEATYADHFENYDNTVNVDGFSLLHNEFFDHLFLLPGVQLQKNNPGKETRTGDAENYVVNYNYTFDGKNIPLTKSGQLTFLNGPHVGQTFQTSSVYTYY